MTSMVGLTKSADTLVERKIGRALLPVGLNGQDGQECASYIESAGSADRRVC